MDERIIWVGNRESEIMYSNLCSKSITKYGTNKNGNISFDNNSSKTITDFILDEINLELQSGPIKLFFYSNNIAERVISKAPHLKEYTINKYDGEFIKIIENKTYSNLWASNIMPIIDFTELFGSECNYEHISRKFKGKEKFIIQENHSSGGTGTYLLTKENSDEISRNFKNHKCYKISPYCEKSFSINTHIIITNDYVSVLPPSIQIIENINDRLLYKGADFISYQKIPFELQDNILKYAKKIGEALKNTGFIGICGLDLLVSDNIIYFMEINPRFQASSILINRALKENNLPDLQTIVYKIFTSSFSVETLKIIENIKINYSTISFYQNGNPKYNEYILKLLLKSSNHIETIMIENENTTTINEYMFRTIFNTNISSLNFDGGIFVYQNLQNYSKYTNESYITNFNLLKCALLTQGVIVDDSVRTFYANKKSIKNATFDAIDISIDKDYVINCPVKTKFVELSPFLIKNENGTIGLFYVNDFLFEVEIALQEQLPIRYTKNNINVHRIGFLTTDRLRIKHTSVCEFKRKNKGCKFCHITSNTSNDIPLIDIYETIDYYIKDIKFRHFLIGGPSNTYENEYYYISNIIKYIRNISDRPIYIMSIPPIDLYYLYEYYQLGASEVAFNLEIFDRTLAKQIMPGKGEIPLSQYERALRLSSKLFGIENTRSMLIIGLDSKTSFLNGVEYLCKIGVTPMISPFRPMENTDLSHMVPPNIDYIWEIFDRAQKICKKHNIELGPKCKFCRNNTLT